MKGTNDIQAIFSSHDPMGEINVKALSTEKWEKDDLLYFDSADQTVKKVTGATAAMKNNFIGIASAGKEVGESLGGVLLRGRLKVKITSATASNLMGSTVTFAYASGKYTFAVAATGQVAHIVENQVTQNGYGLIDFDTVANATNLFGGFSAAS